MYKDLFDKVLDVTCGVSEISKEDLLSSSHQSDVVDIRSMLAYLLNKNGMYPTVIAKFMNKSSAGVRNLIKDYDRRKTSNKILTRISQEVENKLIASLCLNA